jgi:hypothetical protein
MILGKMNFYSSYILVYIIAIFGFAIRYYYVYPSLGVRYDSEYGLDIVFYKIGIQINRNVYI